MEYDFFLQNNCIYSIECCVSVARFVAISLQLLFLTMQETETQQLYHITTDWTEQKCSIFRHSVQATAV